MYKWHFLLSSHKITKENFKVLVLDTREGTLYPPLLDIIIIIYQAFSIKKFTF